MRDRTYAADAEPDESATVAGWGLGGERLVMTMLGLENGREAVLFPWDRQRPSQ